MSSNATGDTQPEPVVVTDEPAAVHVPAPGVPADPADPADLADVPQQAEPADDAEPASTADAAEPADAPTEPAAGAGESADEGESASDGESADAGPAVDDLAAQNVAGEVAGDVTEDVTEAGADGRYDEDADAAEPAGEYRQARRWPRILLAAGFVLAAAGIVAGAIAVVGSLTHGFKKPVKITYKKSAVFSLKTGDCLDPQGQSYTLIACGSPHEAEVFATFTLAGATWPGNTAAASAASNGCKTRLSAYLNPELAVSLASVYVYPDANAWQAGTRTVICEVRASSGQLTGSVRSASATAR